ncbi:MAG: hypothetical protein DMF61_07895 [Blastocatellia bacterium AA13]|nr:MAG: hypothetical protein DMF61_07895 [Blastocatellia bacterium AA13]
MAYRRFTASLAALLLLVAAAAAQTKDDVSGKYEGVAKSAALGEIPLTVEIKNDNGKLTGKLDTPQGTINITDGSYKDGKVALKFDAGGNEGTVNAQMKDGKIVGEWTLAGQTGTLELKKAGETMAGPPPTAPKTSTSSASDPISGEWAANADVQGMSIPFTLKLKLDGDKVTGESTSEQGTAPISKGSFSADKLSILVDTPNGALKLDATLKEGKLVGDLDFASQFQGKWEAKKK